MLTEADVRIALNTVTDPCSLVAGVRAGLVDMGLVTMIRITPHAAGIAVAVQIGLTEPGCLMGHAFVPRARAALAALPGVTAVEVRFDPTLDWSERLMDPDYYARLEAHRATQRLVLCQGGRDGTNHHTTL